ncbi:extended synaptotagmin [Acrasis kona]|uniref:Extended synaptotagmin n=1 Tax=Acrasis kona TaxID=1008807 RepID=A0AAW2Z0T5_9EUKA
MQVCITVVSACNLIRSEGKAPNKPFVVLYEQIDNNRRNKKKTRVGKMAEQSNHFAFNECFIVDLAEDSPESKINFCVYDKQVLKKCTVGRTFFDFAGICCEQGHVINLHLQLIDSTNAGLNIQIKPLNFSIGKKENACHTLLDRVSAS